MRACVPTRSGWPKSIPVSLTMTFTPSPMKPLSQASLECSTGPTSSQSFGWLGLAMILLAGAAVIKLADGFAAFLASKAWIRVVVVCESEAL
ncbi:MAG: LPXTG cell wall anchor domain-containing protein [Chloroflexi bacterium]|nr:LPXTG cell wall anchor domain-containing protein [Chloroflexota bacterium]